MRRFNSRALALIGIASLFLFSGTAAASSQRQVDEGAVSSGPLQQVHQQDPDGPMTEAEIDALVKAIQEQLQAALQRQEDRMQRLIGEVPEKAKPAVENALKRSQEARQRAAERVAQNLERVKSNMLRARANFERAQEKAREARQNAQGQGVQGQGAQGQGSRDGRP